jgi:L-malate glycosyltransferase
VTARRTPRITLLGSASGRNAGDAALIRAIVEGVRREIPGARFEIPTTHPEFIRRSYAADVAEPVSILPWTGSVKFFGVPAFRSVARTDATLVFDAILFDRALRNPLFNYLWPLAHLLRHARSRGRAVVFYDVGVGPIRSDAGRKLLRKAFAAGDLFTFRDPDSFALARQIGLPDRPALLTADAAFDHAPVPGAAVDAILRALDLPPGLGLVGMNVNAYLDTWAENEPGRIDRGRFVEVMAAIADRMIERWERGVVFFVTQHMDLRVTNDVHARMRHASRARVLDNVRRTPEELQGAMGRMELFLGSRLHSLILAASGAVPIVGFAYQVKVTTMLRYLGLAEDALDFSPFELERLWGEIDVRWRRREATAARLRPTIARFRELSAEAARRTAALLEERRSG